MLPLYYKTSKFCIETVFFFYKSDYSWHENLKKMQMWGIVAILKWLQVDKRQLSLVLAFSAPSFGSSSSGLPKRPYKVKKRITSLPKMILQLITFKTPARYSASSARGLSILFSVLRVFTSLLRLSSSRCSCSFSSNASARATLLLSAMVL